MIQNLEYYKSVILSSHFNLWELIVSKQHPELMEDPTEDIVEELRDFAMRTLEPFRIQCCHSTAVHVDSGYRPPKLNAAVGGVSDSIHQIKVGGAIVGAAADLVPLSVSVFDAYKMLPNMEAAFASAILYPRRGFIHLDFRKKAGMRYMVSMTKGVYDELSVAEVRVLAQTLKAKYRFECYERP